MIIRMANVYGEYCSKLVGTMLCMARVYKQLDREMKWLWTKDLKTNTVHVTDVARGLWHAAKWYTDGKANWDENSMGKVPIFNFVDHGDTSEYPSVRTSLFIIDAKRKSDQGSTQGLIGKIFNIKTGFHGTLVSQFARLNLGSAVDEENDELLQPWGQLMNEYSIKRPGPITPYLEGETVKDCDFSIDGSRFEQVTGFQYLVPQLTEEKILEIIESYKRMNWWPPVDEAPKKDIGGKENEKTGSIGQDGNSAPIAS